MLKTIHYLRIVDPLLVAFAAVARIQDDVAATVVQARLVSTDFTRLAEHPVLRQTIPINVTEILTLQACLPPMILTDAIIEEKKKKFTEPTNRSWRLLFNKIDAREYFITTSVKIPNAWACIELNMHKFLSRSFPVYVFYETFAPALLQSPWLSRENNNIQQSLIYLGSDKPQECKNIKTVPIRF